MRPLAFALAGCLALSSGALSPPAASADDRLPGEAADLTPEVRATAQKHVDAIVKLTPDADKAQRALLVLGPAVWPVLENAMRLVPPDAARPRLNYLKALLLKKAEVDFEYLRQRIRRTVLVGDLSALVTEVQILRLGRPDPDHPGKKLPCASKPTPLGSTSVYRSADGTIVVGFGPDGTVDKPDAPDVSLNEAAAGFVAGMGGHSVPAARHSGRGSTVTVVAPQGFAWAWATDGAVGQKPGGSGGEAGAAEAQGGVGQYVKQGKAGANATG